MGEIKAGNLLEMNRKAFPEEVGLSKDEDMIRSKPGAEPGQGTYRVKALR